MKKSLLLIAVCYCSLFCFAEEKIQDTFFGCKLGVSTKSEVEKALAEQGLKYVRTETIFDLYDGEYLHEGVIFKRVCVQYLKDTFSTILFADSCGVQYPEVMKRFKSGMETKYGNIPNLLDESVKQFYFKEAQISDDAIWAKNDQETAALVAGYDGNLFCVYIGMTIATRQAQAAVNELMKIIQELPDYAEENIVSGVAGVKFGDNIETVKKVIGKKTGKYSPLYESNSLTYNNISVGGTKYDFVTFYFNNDKILVSATLQSAYKIWQKNEVLMCYEGIKSQYQGKYSNFKVLADEPEKKFCVCGAYIEGYKYPPITITLKKALSQGGDIMYYVLVQYYEDRLTKVYDDEI